MAQAGSIPAASQKLFSMGKRTYTVEHSIGDLVRFRTGDKEPRVVVRLMISGVATEYGIRKGCDEITWHVKDELLAPEEAREDRPVGFSKDR